MKLPEDSSISVPKLASVFNSTSATYKFYWFWAILDAVENKKVEISKQELFARMISLSWYTVNYYQLSFGKQDLIQKAIERIKLYEELSIDESPDKILSHLLKSKVPETLASLKHFDLNVPHKFISPWVGSGTKKETYQLSENINNSSPYTLQKDRIIIHREWYNYFRNNIGILKSFCFWNLTLFLQSRNPNVPGVPLKIQRPLIRKSLNKHKTNYWDLVIKEYGAIPCIYTGKKLDKGNYAVEHFIPFQFVAHDLMWNLVPADPLFNAKKSSKLPMFETYFDSFFNLQCEGLKIIKTIQPKNKFLQDYLSIFPDMKIDKNKYEEIIKPLLTIANNNGFQYLEL